MNQHTQKFSIGSKALYKPKNRWVDPTMCTIISEVTKKPLGMNFIFQESVVKIEMNGKHFEINIQDLDQLS